MKEWAGYVWSGFGWGLGFILAIVGGHYGGNYISDWWSVGHPWFNLTYLCGILTGVAAMFALGAYATSKI